MYVTLRLSVSSLLFFPPSSFLYLTRFIFIAKWSDSKVRRSFFIDYAAASGIDALDAECWYSQSLEPIANTKVTLPSYYSSSCSSYVFLLLMFVFLFFVFVLNLTDPH